MGRRCRDDDTGDAMQKQVNAGGHARVAAYSAVEHKRAVGKYLAARSRGTQFVQAVWWLSRKHQPGRS